MILLSKLFVLFFAATAVYASILGIKYGLKTVDCIIKGEEPWETSGLTGLSAIVVGISTLSILHFGGWA